jgi:hypothetical protein
MQYGAITVLPEGFSSSAAAAASSPSLNEPRGTGMNPAGHTSALSAPANATESVRTVRVSVRDGNPELSKALRRRWKRVPGGRKRISTWKVSSSPFSAGSIRMRVSSRSMPVVFAAESRSSSRVNR